MQPAKVFGKRFNNIMKTILMNICYFIHTIKKQNKFQAKTKTT